MEGRSVTHAHFVIERSFAAPPARIFAAFADPAVKEKWFAKPDEFDFRVGGHETTHNKFAEDGPTHHYTGRFLDIVPDHRIVTAYDMHLDETRISASLGTLEIWPAGKGARIKYTEQVAFLDGHDNVESRRAGTEGLFDALNASLG